MLTAAQKRKVEELLKKPIKTRKKFDELYDNIMNESSYSTDVLKEFGKTPLSFEGGYYFIDRIQSYYVKNNLIFEICNNFFDPICNCHAFLSLLNKYKNKYVIIADADRGSSMSGADLSLSFECLGQFLDMDGERTKNIFNKRFTVLDFTGDETKPLNAKDRKLLKTNVRVTRNGWTVVNEEWHRSSTCLLKDKKTRKHILLGQDEGTYFGCELKGKPITINEAFEDLVPPEAKGKNYQRQGEWFLVPSEMPPIENAAIFCSSRNSSEVSFNLPIDDKNSNEHTVKCDFWGLFDGVIYARNGSIVHDEHQTLTFYDTVAFCKNTAVKSVSQEGVD